MRVSESLSLITVVMIIVGGMAYMFVFGRQHPNPPRVPKTPAELQAETDQKIVESNKEIIDDAVYNNGGCSSSKMESLDFEYASPSGEVHPVVKCRE